MKKNDKEHLEFCLWVEVPTTLI